MQMMCRLAAMYILCVMMCIIRRSYFVWLRLCIIGIHLAYIDSYNVYISALSSNIDDV